MAGIVPFWDYQDKYTSTRFDLWNNKNQLDILENTNFDDRVALQNDWKNQVVIRNDLSALYEPLNANDDHYDNTGFFTQEQRYNAWNDYLTHNI